MYYRLDVISMHAEPLRERKEDLSLLTEHFMVLHSEENHKKIKNITEGALQTLAAYNWPGNIRELENIIERAVVLARSDILTSGDLPLFVVNPVEKDNELSLDDSKLPLPERMHIIEKNIISLTLKKHGFNQSKAAADLGISESGLRYKIRVLKIKK